jgi:hypothetical protein
VRRPERIDNPSVVFLMSNQSSNADDRVVDVLGELVTHDRADLVIALAVMTVGGDARQEGTLGGSVERSGRTTPLVSRALMISSRKSIGLVT